MNSMTRPRFARRFALLAGALDLGTGLLLLAVPALTLRAMGAAPPPAGAWLYVRLIGVFVAAVGGSYLFGATWQHATALPATLQITLLFRLGAGMFTGTAVALSRLDPAWLIVTATDLSCAAVQVWLLADGRTRDA